MTKNLRRFTRLPPPISNPAALLKVFMGEKEERMDAGTSPAMIPTKILNKVKSRYNAGSGVRSRIIN